jgi:hypothetical protein
LAANDYSVNPTNKFKNLSLFNNDPKIHPVIEIAQKSLVVLDSELIQRFCIQEGDLVLQKAEDNCIRLVFAKNRTSQKVSINRPINNEDQGV